MVDFKNYCLLGMKSATAYEKLCKKCGQVNPTGDTEICPNCGHNLVVTKIQINEQGVCEEYV